MGFGLRMRFDPIRSLAAAGFDPLGVYMPVGLPLTVGANQFLIENLTDKSIMFSIGGIIDHLVLPANGYFLSDVTSNKTIKDGGLFLAENERLYAKLVTVPPITGAVYFSIMYGSES